MGLGMGIGWECLVGVDFTWMDGMEGITVRAAVRTAHFFEVSAQIHDMRIVPQS